MSNVQHPSAWIHPAAVETIRSKAKEAEALQQLHPDQLALIYANKWFKLYVPRMYNGLELSLVEALQTEEALAWADGSLGWTVTLCSGANWFIGFLQPEAAAIFQEDTVCLAGSGKASGTASITEGGYLINGQWNYATGAPHATHFTVNCVIEKDGVALQTPDGNPLIRSFFFTKEEVTIHHNWFATGMIATASNSFTVENRWVPENRCFRIDSEHAVLPHPIFQYPFLQFAEATLAVNYSGMAQHFLDLCKPLFAKKNNEALVTHLHSAQTRLYELRTFFYEAVKQLSPQHSSPTNSETTLLQNISNTSYLLARVARKIVDDMYPLCGLHAADSRTELNQVWRDLHTASQHTLLNTLKP